MKLLKKAFMIIIITTITITLVSNIQIDISAKANCDSNNRKVTNIAVIVRSFSDPFNLSLKQSFEEIQKENEDKVKFTIFDGQNNINTQNQIIDSIVQNNENDIELLIVNLADVAENSVKEVINKTKPENIPLVLLQVAPETILKVPKYNRVVFVAGNSERAGISQGKILIDLWNTNKKVIDKNNDNVMEYIMLKGKAESEPEIQRTKSSIATLKNSGIKIQELASVNANWSKDLAKNYFENLFIKYGDKIEVVIGNNDAMAIGVTEILQKYGYNKGDKSKYITVIGVDGTQEAKDLVDKGFMAGTVIQDIKPFAEQMYNVGMNLVNYVDPLKNTNLKFKDGEIIVTLPYEAYIGRTKSP
ncbi:galactose ABC transporter substrate-binding protein [Clostridium sp. SHJSY1]|uniref:galactose ABC transporter substrate-binding protein n=1 Tax=Clostridium sp. SHJSY1 TaxID=2942483 RepID=UPI002874C1DA|nr:galactose ABC transporter substrate-binding protein [Clostridium sp. SHJSY1]MDS0526099.1 galactose ABC transporter substrate-binding protein [Clostridium sp. SHJSY1]